MRKLAEFLTKETLVRMKLALSILVGLTLAILACHVLEPSEPTGKCIYGPAGYKACVSGTTQKDCVENFRGAWYGGQKCN